MDSVKMIAKLIKRSLLSPGEGQSSIFFPMDLGDGHRQRRRPRPFIAIWLLFLFLACLSSPSTLCLLLSGDSDLIAQIHSSAPLRRTFSLSVAVVRGLIVLTFGSSTPLLVWVFIQTRGTQHPSAFHPQISSQRSYLSISLERMHQLYGSNGVPASMEISSPSPDGIFWTILPTLSRRCYRVLAACFTSDFGHGYHTGTVPQCYLNHDPIFFKPDLTVVREHSMTEVFFSAQNRVHSCDSAKIFYCNSTADYNGHPPELTGVSCVSIEEFPFCPWCRIAAQQKDRVKTLISKTGLWARVNYIAVLMCFGSLDPDILEDKNDNLGFKDFCSWAKYFKFRKRSLSFGPSWLVILLDLYSYYLVVSNFGRRPKGEIT